MPSSNSDPLDAPIAGTEWLEFRIAELASRVGVLEDAFQPTNAFVMALSKMVNLDYHTLWEAIVMAQGSPHEPQDEYDDDDAAEAA